MAQEHALGPVLQIPEGEGRNFVVEGRRIAVFRVRSGGVFATQPNCPHAGGPLADGLLGVGADGPNVVCPLHDLSFDLGSGDGSQAGCRIAVYPARVGPDGTIRITLEPAMAEADAGE